MGKKEDIQLLDLLVDRLAVRLLRAESGSNEDEEEPNGVRRRRKKKTGYALPRTVSEESILSLVREKGPMRVAEIMERTGLTQSAAHKKVATLRTSGALKQVKEGTRVLYMIPPHGGRGRKTAPKKKRRSKKTSSSSTEAK
jgi:predicted HTH transcriptional regulator